MGLINRAGIRKRRRWLGWLGFLLLYGASYVQAADIAVIKSDSIKPYNEARRGFKSVIGGRLKEYDLQGDMSQGKQLIAEVISQEPDLVYTIGTKAAIIARENIDQLPIVFSMVSRPERCGLDRSNIAGVSINISAKDQFRVLKTILGNVKRVGVIYNPQLTGGEIEQAGLAAHKLGLELLPHAAPSQQDVLNVLRGMMDKIEVLWLTMDETFLGQLTVKHIILSATRHKIPILGFSPRFIKNGVLLAPKADYFDMGVQAGELALSILDQKGLTGGRIVSPRKITPVINLRVANFLGLEIAPQLLERSELYE